MYEHFSCSWFVMNEFMWSTLDSCEPISSHSRLVTYIFHVKYLSPRSWNKTDIDVFNLTKFHPYITVILYVKYNSTSIAGSLEHHFIDVLFFHCSQCKTMDPHASVQSLHCCTFVNKYFVCLHLIVLGITPSFKLSCICLSWSTGEDWKVMYLTTTDDK